MSDRTTTQIRGTQHAKTARRGGPSGRLVVGEYVGQVAAEAAQAVRRAGLCPGLDRSFGCETELVGQVVAQEPAAGEELARNGLVTLYVAAPGDAPLQDDTDAPEASSDIPGPSPAHAETTQPDIAGEPTTVRRRKPGMAVRAPQTFDLPPAPVLPGREPDGGWLHAAPGVDVDPAGEERSPTDTYAWDSEDLDEGVLDERGEDELSHDEFVVHMDEAFAGRTPRPAAWRRVYPRRHTIGALAGSRRWLAEHPRLRKIVLVGLAIWIVVALTATLDAHHTPRTPTGAVKSGRDQPAGRKPTAANDRRPATARPSVRPRWPHARHQRHEARKRRSRPALVRRTLAHRERTSAPVTPTPQTSPPPSAGSEPEPELELEQTGGLFTP